MTTVTQTRLDAYLAAEIAILKAQEIRNGDRTFRQTELSDVRDQIDKLQRQVAREAASAIGNRGLNFAVANLSGSGQ
jgi:hypothetical protein